MITAGRNDPCPCGAKTPDGKPVKYKKCCLPMHEKMRVAAQTHIRLTDCRLNGIAASNALPGEQVKVLVRALLTSDQPEFYTYMKGISGVLASRVQAAGGLFSPNYVSTLLLVTHEDGSADLHLQDVPMLMEVLAKRDVTAGEVVYQSGIADVRRVQFSDLQLKPDDGVFVCFKVGWKFALFFDLAADRALDVDRMERDLGRLYRLLAFQDLYEALGDDALFASLVQAGWFPFIEIIGGEFEKLLNAHRAGFNISGEETALLQKFDKQRIDAMAERWWKRPSLKDRREILEPALEAFKRNDPVACLKIILTEMEGVLQDAHIAEVGSGAKIKDLLKFAAERGLKKTGDESSLLFPNQFLRYLSQYTYADFDPKNPPIYAVSRHTAGHGRAAAAAYTQMRALQAILTLDQLSFYL